MCIKASAVGVDDGRCKDDTLTGCGAAVGRDLGNMCRMRTRCRIMGAPLRAGGKVFLIGAQVGIGVAVYGCADGGKPAGASESG